MDKRSLRHVMRARRAGCDRSLGLSLSVFDSGLIAPDAVLAAYWPIGTEIDTRDVMTAACDRSMTVCLPITPRPGAALTFATWHPGASLRPGRLGILEPAGSPVVPTVLLVPLLAFDRRGGRLGYGGGFYDRTLAALPPTTIAIGCAFTAQEMDTVPMETHDRAMHAIATEVGMVFLE